jgi:hypothetical protein
MINRMTGAALADEGSDDAQYCGDCLYVGSPEVAEVGESAP